MEGRYAAIDGLRGFLAFFVFLHHSSIWYFYLRSSKWDVPPSNLYTHFGQSSVALFFMITGFLFFSKLIDGRKKSIDWQRLYVSRFLRLTPLYVCVVTCVLVLAFAISGWVVNEPLAKLATELVRWLGFTVLGSPNINGVNDTFAMVAGVTWSLAYEWAFYFSLPLFALCIGVRPPPMYIVVSLIVTAFVALHPNVRYLSFIGGIAAAVLVRYDVVRKVASTRFSSLVAIGCLAATVAFFSSPYEFIPLFLLSVFFVLIASGNSLFGVLLTSTARKLGEFAYSIYLLHGLLLFVVFHFVLGRTQASDLSPIQHWCVVVGVTPVLVGVCFLTYTFIEHPPMQMTSKWTASLRSLQMRLR